MFCFVFDFTEKGTWLTNLRHKKLFFSLNSKLISYLIPIILTKFLMKNFLEFQKLFIYVFENENKVKCQVCYDCLTRSIFPSWSSPLLKQNHEDFIGHLRQEMGRFGRDPWHNQIPYFTLWTKSFCWCH